MNRTKKSTKSKKSYYNTHITGLDTLMQESQEDPLELPIHIGIATGDVFLAIVGDENSRAERMDIGFIGEAYNRCQALL